MPSDDACSTRKHVPSEDSLKCMPRSQKCLLRTPFPPGHSVPSEDRLQCLQGHNMPADDACSTWTDTLCLLRTDCSVFQGHNMPAEDACFYKDNTLCLLRTPCCVSPGNPDLQDSLLSILASSFVPGRFYLSRILVLLIPPCALGHGHPTCLPLPRTSCMSPTTCDFTGQYSQPQETVNTPMTFRVFPVRSLLVYGP
jgi:hypothetical protein